MMASTQGRLEMVMALLAAGSDKDAMCSVGGVAEITEKGLRTGWVV